MLAQLLHDRYALQIQCQVQIDDKYHSIMILDSVSYVKHNCISMINAMKQPISQQNLLITHKCCYLKQHFRVYYTINCLCVGELLKLSIRVLKLMCLTKLSTTILKLPFD